MEFVIEDSIDRPARGARGSNRTSTYPFGTMKVGQSFKVGFTSDDKAEREKVIRRVRAAYLAFKKSHEGFEFQTWSAIKSNLDFEKVEKDGVEGLRVKRVEFTPEVAPTNEATA